MLNEHFDKDPEYKLLGTKKSPNPCHDHPGGLNTIMYDDNWEKGFVDLDRIELRCKKCGEQRVYQILPEKTIL